MKKNLYYRRQYQRGSALNNILIYFLEFFSLFGRAALEITIRKNIGERRFSLFTALFIAVVLAILPFTARIGYGYPNVWETILDNISWYLTIILFLFFCRKRMVEMKRLPSVFDFERFSLSSGEVHPLFRKIKFGGKPADIRQIETLLEPAFFLATGIALLILQQKIGLVISIFSLMYSLSYYLDYKSGDNFVMDVIDERICTESMMESFSDGFESEENKGFQFRGRKPADPNKWRKVVDDSIIDSDFADAF